MKFFRNNSISAQMFRSIFLISGLILMVFFAVSLHMLQSSYAREEETIIQDNLVKCGRIADISLEYINQSAKAVATNAAVLGAVVAPNHKLVDRSITVMNLLSDVTKSNEMVSDAALYLNYDHSIYTSEMQESHVYKDKKLNSLLKEYLTNVPSGENAVFYSLDHEAYMVQDIPVGGHKRLGTLVLQIDQDKLFSKIQDTGDHSYMIVRDPESSLTMMSPEVPETVQADVLGGSSSVKGLSEAYVSDVYHLNIYNWRQDGVSVDGMRKYAPLYLLALLLGAMTIGASAFAARAASRPIRNLVDLVSVDAVPKQSEDKNEIEYIREMFGTMLEDRQSLISTTTLLIPEIERRLLLDIVRNPASKEHAREYFKNIHSGFAKEGVFAVLAMDIAEPEQSAPVENYEYQLRTILEQDISAWNMNHLRYQLLHVEKSSWMLMIMAHTDQDKGELQRQLYDLLGSCKETLQAQGFKMRVGFGGFSNTVESIDEGYRIARGALQEQIAAPGNVEETVIGEQEIYVHLNRCTDEYLEHSLDHAKAQIRKFEELLRAYVSSTEQIHRISKLYFARLSKLYQLYALNGMVVISAEEDVAATITAISNAGYLFVNALAENCSKKSNRQILGAKRYIMENYQNGMLSLGEVAEVLGVKSTYLSTLFSGANGERFSDFLKNYRIDIAKQLLNHSTMSIGEIGEQCGFNSIQSFSRVFKQTTGRTPGEYRTEKLRKKQ